MVYPRDDPLGDEPLEGDDGLFSIDSQGVAVTTMVLAGLGAAWLGVVGWRRKKR